MPIENLIKTDVKAADAFYKEATNPNALITGMAQTFDVPDADHQGTMVHTKGTDPKNLSDSDKLLIQAECSGGGRGYQHTM